MSTTEEDIAADLALPSEEVVPKDTHPYKKLGDSKIPVSKHAGSVWKSRRDAVLKLREQFDVTVAWDEAIRYYENDQLPHRSTDRGDAAGNIGNARRIVDAHSETENLIFSNINALNDSVYARNPTPEITALDPALDNVVPMIERLSTAISYRRVSPGVNMKTKARRAIVITALTNSAYFLTGWTFKDNTSDAAIKELEALSVQYEKAKTPQEIERIEGKLIALEGAVSFLRRPGPSLRVLMPHQVIVDPASENDDHSDANWMMYFEFVPTAFLAAVYGKETKGDVVKSIYQPTHVLVADNKSNIDEQIANFSLLSESQDHKTLGFDSQEAYDAAKFTKVWHVWDATTRRVFLYNDKDWSWPIWVWDDPLKLQEFFPLDRLSFHTTATGREPRGEVTYYLDQQDAINGINSEIHRAREYARFNLFVDERAAQTPDEISDIFTLRNEFRVKTLKVPEGFKMSDLFYSIIPPALQHPELFDKSQLYSAIDRISAINLIMRGEEFKTNTTNKAIDRYEATTTARVEGKIDRIEDVLGSVYWKIIQLCMMYMGKEDVSSLIGVEQSNNWRNLTHEEIRHVALRVDGGSTIKPTSSAKKQEAIQVAQTLGQFASAGPAAAAMAFKTALTVLSRAFDEMVIRKEEWEVLEAAAQGAVPPEIAAQVIDQMLSQLPPPARAAIGNALAQGAPLTEALAAATQLTSTQGGNRRNVNGPQ